MKEYCYIICFLIIGCNNNTNTSRKNDISYENEKLNLQDSTNSKRSLPGDVDSNRIRASIKEILNDWSASYNDSLIIDTSFSIEGKSVYLRIKNYCLFDSSLIIPEVYVSHLWMKEFVSNDFASSLLMKINNKIVVDTVIDKSFFLDLLSCTRSELYNYGALIFNGIEIRNNLCKIKYIIEIPLSDVGSGFDANVFYSGKIETVDASLNK